MTTDKSERIMEFICDFTNIEPDRITPDTNIISELTIDSISLLNIAVAIENEFGIEISEDDITNISTIRDFVEMIESKQVN